MSEQSPWGTPPPTQPGGSTPGGPASPTGPPTGPPAGPPAGPPGYGPPSYGPGPGSWGPPPGPPRRRTGLIAGLLTGLVLLAVVAVVVTVLATRGGDDDPETTTPTTPTASSTSSTSSPAPTDGSTVAGTGYTISLPGPGWQDATADKEDLGSGIDVAIILGSSFDTAQSNILTEALPAPPGADVESLRGIFLRNLVGTDGATTEAVDDSELDGERAVGYRIERTNTAGVPIVQIAYLAVHDEQQYSAVVTYPATGDSVSEPDFETVIDSWTWTD